MQFVLPHALHATFERYLGLRKPIRGLLRLHWLYSFTDALWSVFIHIYIYELFADISFNMLGTIVQYFGIMVGFCILGTWFAFRHFNVRLGFFIAFVVLGASFSFLWFASKYAVLVYMLVSGIGQGLYWLSLHTYELHETNDSERDFYSSLLNSGSSVLVVCAPFVATMLLIMAAAVGLNQFTFLFIAAPMLYFYASSTIRVLSDYRPQPIEWADFRYFFFDKRNIRIQPYLAGTALQNVLGLTIVPLISVVILGSAINVGVFNTSTAIIAALFVAWFGVYRNRGNRLLILGVAMFLRIPFIIFLGWSLSFVSLLLFQLGKVFFGPLAQVSTHVISLETMELIGRKGSDFYATMIMRDLSLWLWRTVGGLVFLFVVAHVPLDLTALSYGMYMFAGSFLLIFFGAAWLLDATRALPHITTHKPADV